MWWFVGTKRKINIFATKRSNIIHGLLNRWTIMSPFLFLISGQHEAGTWDQNYTPGVNILDQDFYNLKNSRQASSESNFILIH